MGGYPTVVPQGPALPYVLAPRHATLEDQRGADHALAGSRLEYLTPFWPVILADYGVTIVLHPGSDWAALAAGFCGIARAAGLADLGRRVELVDHSVRRGEGDPELADVLQGRLRSRTVRATGAATSSHTANHPGTPGPAAKRRGTRLREIVTAWVELSPVTSGSISEAARRPDWRAPCIHARFPEACSPAK